MAYPGPHDTIETEQVLIEKIKHRLRYHLDASRIKDTSSFIVELDPLLQHLVIQLGNDVWEEVLQTETGVVFEDIPKTWFDHFKLEVFPKWLLDKFPARTKTIYKKIKYQRSATYPKLVLDRCHGNQTRVMIMKERFFGNENRYHTLE